MKRRGVSFSGVVFSLALGTARHKKQKETEAVVRREAGYEEQKMEVEADPSARLALALQEAERLRHCLRLWPYR